MIDKPPLTDKEIMLRACVCVLAFAVVMALCDHFFNPECKDGYVKVKGMCVTGYKP